MVAALDALRGHWKHTVRRQQATQMLLAGALLCELLLWARRAEWGALLPIYGLWAYTTREVRPPPERLERTNPWLPFWRRAVV